MLEKLPDMLYCDLVTLVVIVWVAESYCNLSPGMQCLEQQGLSILLHIAEGLGLRFKLLPEGGACLLFLLHSFSHVVLQACASSVLNQLSSCLTGQHAWVMMPTGLMHARPATSCTDTGPVCLPPENVLNT